jgi:hypothetical protein
MDKVCIGGIRCESCGNIEAGERCDECAGSKVERPDELLWKLPPAATAHPTPLARAHVVS